MYTNNKQLDNISEPAKERWLWLTDEMVYRTNNKKFPIKIVVEEFNYRKYNTIIGVCVVLAIVVTLAGFVIIKIGIDKLLN